MTFGCHCSANRRYDATSPTSMIPAQSGRLPAGLQSRSATQVLTSSPIFSIRVVTVWPKVGGSSILKLLSVHIAFNTQVRRMRNLLWCNKKRTNRCHVVPSLALQSFTRAKLPVANRYVIAHRVARYGLACLGSCRVTDGFSDDDSKLDLEVTLLALKAGGARSRGSRPRKESPSEVASLTSTARPAEDRQRPEDPARGTCRPPGSLLLSAILRGQLQVSWASPAWPRCRICLQDARVLEAFALCRAHRRHPSLACLSTPSPPSLQSGADPLWLGRGSSEPAVPPIENRPKNHADSTTSPITNCKHTMTAK